MENWLPVVGWEGIYEVSDQGRVRSLDRIIETSRGQWRLRGRMLRPSPAHLEPPIKYRAVDLQFERRTQYVRLHVLVLEAFVGPRPDGMAACHNDGDINNNTVGNLRWDTYSSNNYDLTRHGTHWQSSKTHCKHGHEFTPENTLIRTSGHRKCRKCHADAMSCWYENRGRAMRRRVAA